MLVTKRDGSIEPLNIDNIHKMVELACEGLDDVSISLVEVTSQIEFYDKIPTNLIQNILIAAANKLITLDSPNYQYVAARLLLFDLYKSLYPNWKYGFPSVKQHLINFSNYYDSTLLETYTDTEWDILNQTIKHERDYIFTYAGLQQLCDKYLITDTRINKIVETPQYAYILLAASVFKNSPPEKRIKLITDYYDLVSTHKISLPSPIISGVRSTNKSYASCCLIAMGDTVDSINATNSSIVKYTSMSSGIGVDMGRISAIDTPIRNGQIKHLGVIPILKTVEAGVKAFSQISRGGSATVFFPLWHYEIEDIIVLKNNKGTDDNRVRKLDYCIQMSKLFYERFLDNSYITLFSPREVPGLYDAYGTEEFDDLYLYYEKSNVRKKTVPIVELFTKFVSQRRETGRNYVLNIDHANTHSPYLETVHQSNLCVAADSKINIFSGGNFGNFYIKSIAELPDFMDVGDDGKINEPVSCISYNVENNSIVYSDINNVFKTSDSALVISILNLSTGNRIKCTPNHKVYTINDGYKAAYKLQPSDMLFDLDDCHNLLTKDDYDPSVKRLVIEAIDEPEEVWDMTVEGTHNFFCNNILVHNCVEIIQPTVPLSSLDDIGITKKNIKVPIQEYDKFLEMYTKNNYILMD